MVSFERALATSCRPSIVTFPLSLHVSKILPLLCSSTPLFSSPTLVSPKFPYVSLGIGGWPLGYEERTCWANCPCNSLQDFQPMWSWSTNVTDRQTDGQAEGRLAIAIPRFALKCIARYKWIRITAHCVPDVLNDRPSWFFTARQHSLLCRALY